MKVAVIYNRDSQSVINLFGQPNREKIGLQLIKQICDSLKKGGHTPTSFEGDKDLVDRLEDFMPAVVKGERPGMVLNLSYGIQGQARYTHVPSILEMVGIPYVGSGPLAHSIALDKVVTKMILVQYGLPTPGFAVLENADFAAPDLEYPLIVKPKHEAVSFGIKVVNDEAELREAAQVIFDMFGQAVLCEQFIEGREVNVALLGNAPAQPLPPVELSFGDGPSVYRYEDKTGKSGRKVELVCPAPLDEETTTHVQDLARRAFSAIGCYDCARVDFRLDNDGNFHILEINSLPALGPRGSYVRAAKEAGLDFADLVNRLVEEASARYFGTPSPPEIGTKKAKDPETGIFNYLTQRRDRIEKRVREWTDRGSRTSDVIGLDSAERELDRVLVDTGLAPVADLTERGVAKTWATPAGLDGGTLLVGHLDVPLADSAPGQHFRREPEWLYGEGIATSRAPLVITEFALRALKSSRMLRTTKLGVMYYRDEGRDAVFSNDVLRRAMTRAKRVLVLRPAGPDGGLYMSRRGHRIFKLTVEGAPVAPGRASKRPEALVWTAERISAIAALSSRKQRVSASLLDMRTVSFANLLPHRVRATVVITYADLDVADTTEASIREILGKKGPQWQLERVSDRPPLHETKKSKQVFGSIEALAGRWEIPIESASSVWPSVAGLSPDAVPAVCGVGPVGRDLNTPQEAVQRISILQRALLLAQLLAESPSGKRE